MDRARWITAIVVMAILLGAGPLVWSAEAFKVAVIDQQAVLDRSRAGKRAMESLKEFSASRQKIVAADDEELKKLEAELKNQESALSEGARHERQEQFRLKFEGYQRRLQEFNREIQTKQKGLADDYQKKIDQAAAAVAEKGGYAMVLDKGSDATLRIVIYASNAIDITDQVVKEFDRRNK